MREKKEIKGSYTIETAAMMPVIMFILVLSITLTFYCYDKCILMGIASEAAAASSEELRNEDDLSGIRQNAGRATGKRLLLFGRGSVSVSQKEDQVTVELRVTKGAPPMRCEVRASACTKEAENYIRLYRLMRKDE